MSVAFPREPFDNVANVSTEPGRPVEMARDMTLRDYFAGQAMQAIVGDERALRACSEAARKEPGATGPDLIARAAYAYADAMLAARES